MSIADLRKEYMLAGLSESDIDNDPLKQFSLWLDQAIAASLIEPTAMMLATVGDDGRPSARMVLLKGVDASGFHFYTNYESRKGHELAEHPFAALVFYWGGLERQVRVEGYVERLSPEASDAYFQSRPQGSQLGSAVSHQSQVIADRDVLEQRMRELRERYQDQPIPRPAFWGGYRVIPDTIEFWQGRPNRLHDRLRYRKHDDGSWRIERLSP
jgi:pyridoxamine 5'-phosphate oxidase